MTTLPCKVKIVEVGPRDGLQNESLPVPTEVKLEFIKQLASSGLKHIEATSFVSPKAVPQLADAIELAKALPGDSGVTYSALVPNEKGLDRAIEAGIRRVAVFTAASETFTQKNIRMSIDQSFAAFEPVVRRALSEGMTVRGYVSTAFVCPYDGEIKEEAVRNVSVRLVDLGVDEVAISDTVGAAAPNDVRRVIEHVLDRVPIERIALHFHDTYGTALANVYAGLELGISTFDASAGGLGGCPFAPGASGNLATEDIVCMLDRMGIDSGVSLDGVIRASKLILQYLNRAPHSRNGQRLLKTHCS